MKRVLMVCLGNICRSPLAAGILSSKINPSQIDVDSAGTAAYHIGEAPDRRAIEVAKKYNIDISSHKARQFTLNDFDIFDYIYVMDNANYEDLIRKTTHLSHLKKIKRIMDVIYPQQKIEVPDPYYGGKQGFENVYQMLNEACTKIAQERS